MPRIVSIAATIGITLALALVVVLLMTRGKGRTPPPPVPSGFSGVAVAPADPEAPQPGFEDWAMPEFSLTNQDEEPINASILDGSWTVGAFVFTNCPFACPGMTSEMIYIAGELESTPTRFLSMSVDPVHDTPERLREYASELNIDTDRWVFATGESGEVASIVTDALKLTLEIDNDTVIPTSKGESMANIAHPTRLLLIAPDRSIRGLYAYDSRQQMDELLDRLKRIHGVD